jgi:hypothetical protein
MFSRSRRLIALQYHNYPKTASSPVIPETLHHKFMPRVLNQPLPEHAFRFTTLAMHAATLIWTILQRVTYLFLICADEKSSFYCGVDLPGITSAPPQLRRFNSAQTGEPKTGLAKGLIAFGFLGEDLPGKEPS